MFKCFVTGTGTDVGKTIVTAGLASLCVGTGMSTLVVKPVQTGMSEGDGDMDVVAALVPEIGSRPHAVRTLAAFRYPASPHLAAELEGVEIDVGGLLDDLESLCGSGGFDALIVEGAGGIMVPLTRTVSTLDFVKRLNIPAVVVAGAGLGTLNHTFLTVAAMRSAGVEVAGLVVNMMSEDPDTVERDNIETLATLSGVPLLAAVRDFRGTPAPETLRLEFSSQPDLVALISGSLGDGCGKENL